MHNYCYNSNSKGLFLPFFLNLQYFNSNVIDNNSTIPFDVVISNNGFTYNNNNNNNIIVNNNGSYIIIYQLNVDGSASTTAIKTTILVNGNVVHTSNGVEVQGQSSGSTALYLNKGDIIQIINSTGEEIEISFANIVIYGI